MTDLERISKRKERQRRGDENRSPVAKKRRKNARTMRLRGEYPVKRAYIDAKKSVPCMDCGNTYPTVCMDFDHVRGVKRFTVSQMSAVNLENVIAEIEKCDVVCSNCHRIRTHVRHQKALEPEVFSDGS